MVFITENTWKNNGIEVIIVNNIKWLNEKHLENNLGHSNLSTLTLKYVDCFKKQRCELIDTKYQPCRRFIREDLAIQLIMDTRTIQSIEQSILTKKLKIHFLLKK